MTEWRTVPAEPTLEMIRAVGTCDVPEGQAWLDDDARRTWAAMLSAAPAPVAMTDEAAVDSSAAALRTLIAMGYSYTGGQLWRPPIGPAPDFSIVDRLTAERDALRAEVTAWRERFPSYVYRPQDDCIERKS